MKSTAVVLALIVSLLFGLSLEQPSYAKEDYTFSILYTGDEHSALIPHSPAVNYDPDIDDFTRGGFARLKTLISEFREERENEDEPVLLVSSGDFHSGNLYSWLAFSDMAPELDLMQKMGYDIVTLGNHEYDFGAEFISEYLKNAGYPEKKDETKLLATNSYIPSDHSLSERGIKKNYLKELPNGLKVGFIGLLGDDGQYFILDSEPVEFTPVNDAARDNIDKLKKEGADVIVAVNHSGREYNNRLAEEVDGIDIIIGGHTHIPMHQPDKVNDTYIFEPGSHGEFLGKLMLGYNKENDEVTIRNEEYEVSHLTRVNHEVEEDEEIKNEVNRYTEKLNEMIEEITDGRFTDILEHVARSENIIRSRPRDRETPMGNLITDAMRFSVKDMTGEDVDFAFQANGQIRGDVIPGDTGEAKNKVSIYDMARLAGLGKTPERNPGYPMVLIHLTGKEIHTLLELTPFLNEYMGEALFMQTSGLRYSYDPDRAVLFYIPFLDIPVPTFRAVQTAEKYTGSGPQIGGYNKDAYEQIKRDDSRLYSVAADTYVMQFLPELGERLSHLSIEPKNARGEKIQNIEDAKVMSGDKAYTVWEGLLDYSRARGDISEYDTTTERISTASSFNLMILIWAVAGAIIGIIVGLGVYVKRKFSK
ncbi:bifunctional metallophosphatase/5'-nucleotidase [Natranaerofaba carboxydovora]|uniref:bifunctional metallophosphatase/5'-nucleotidase n=1 Tax=Natranaerofaba carboxydovora TaxID=2742683 RepID=UPI001F12D0AC|nr:bifunctional UDP-sugar hydrolase/5'-nucleotidase [Natranaerofaba carboxydovora]